jgi:hypothetical protein
LPAHSQEENTKKKSHAGSFEVTAKLIKATVSKFVTFSFPHSTHKTGVANWPYTSKYYASQKPCKTNMSAVSHMAVPWKAR